MASATEDIIRNYIQILDAIYGVYLDGCRGFDCAKSVFEQSQLSSIENNKSLQAKMPPNSGVHLNTTIDDFDSSCLVYSKGTEETGDYRRLHYCPTQAQYKMRNSPEGDNYRFIGNMALISIYEYWESSCRNKLADCNNVEYEQIKSQIFGDLRLLRNSIIHHGGIALPSIKACKKFTWYKEGDLIFIDGDQMEDIVASIKESQRCLYFI